MIGFRLNCSSVFYLASNRKAVKHGSAFWLVHTHTQSHSGIPQSALDCGKIGVRSISLRMGGSKKTKMSRTLCHSAHSALPIKKILRVEAAATLAR